MSLPEQKTTRKGRVDKTTSRLEFENSGNSKEYVVEAICNSTIYVMESESYLSNLYYLVFWKGYPDEKNIEEPVLSILYIRKLISTFHHDYPDKPTATSPSIDSTPPIARPTIMPRAEVSDTK